MRSAVVAGLQRSRPSPPVSVFEFWPAWAFYTPIVVQWIALGLRYGDFSLPTAANPLIEVGGLCGESKTAILDQIADTERDVIAPYVCLVPTDIAACDAAMQSAGLAYPVVAKPDIGCNGAGVRLIADRLALENYVAAFPSGARLMLQHYIPYEGEAGLFYVRRPREAQGRITSVTLKRVPEVIGDGRSTLRALILADPRASRARHQYFPHLAARLDSVPCQGERVRLVFVGNHCKGSIFTNGRDHITPALTARVEAIARSLPEFHFGRFDVRYRSLAELRHGAGFSVIEVNGVGSEATHVWDARTRPIAGLARPVRPLRRGVRDRGGEPGARPAPVGPARDGTPLATAAAHDGDLSHARLNAVDQVTTLGSSIPVRARMPASWSAIATSGANTWAVSASCRDASGSNRSI